MMCGMRLRIGAVSYDLTDRVLVMGILNRTRDSFYDGGAYFSLDDLLRRAERLVSDGADLLDVGARAGGVGTRALSVAEERDLAAETVAALVARFDVPISIDTWHAAVAAAAYTAGAVLGNDMSGFYEPSYLTVAKRAGATVVVTHLRRPPPGTPDPDATYDDVVADVVAALRDLLVSAEAAGIAADRMVVDPGLDLGKSWRDSLRLLARLDAVAALGRPVLLATSHKIFLGRLLNLPTGQRGAATLAACVWGIERGARILRVHDARSARHAADLTAALRAELRTEP